MRTAFLTVTVILAALLAAPVASACTLAPTSSPRERVKAAAVAVYGEVVDRELVRASETPSPNAEYRYRFRVLKTYKGRPGRTMTLLAGTNEAMCEAGLLRVGERFGLVLRKRRGPWRISLGSFISKRDLERATRRRG